MLVGQVRIKGAPFIVDNIVITIAVIIRVVGGQFIEVVIIYVKIYLHGRLRDNLLQLKVDDGEILTATSTFLFLSVIDHKS